MNIYCRTSLFPSQIEIIRILALFQGKIVGTFDFDTIKFNMLTHSNTNVTVLTFTHDA